MLNWQHMKNAQVIKIYDQIAEEYARLYDPIESGEDLVFLNTFLGHLKPGAHIVDLGSGTGFASGYFVKNGMMAEGVDLSSSMIKIAKRNYPEIIFSLEDMTTFKPKEKVDAVWAGYSLFHLEQKDFEETLKNIRLYLKPGGCFGCVMQEGTGELEVDEPLLPSEKIYVHLYSKQELQEILYQNNFDVVEIKRKEPMHEMEFPYNKLLLIAK